MRLPLGTEAGDSALESGLAGWLTEPPLCELGDTTQEEPEDEREAVEQAMETADDCELRRGDDDDDEDGVA